MVPFPYRIMVEWSDRDEAFVARIPALNVATHGDTEAEAAHEAKVAADLVLAVMREDGDAAPASDVAADYAGKIALRMPRSMHAQVARLAQAEDVSVNQLLVSLIARGLSNTARG